MMHHKASFEGVKTHCCMIQKSINPGFELNRLIESVLESAGVRHYDAAVNILEAVVLFRKP
jgi:hypothetical protein